MIVFEFLLILTAFESAFALSEAVVFERPKPSALPRPPPPPTLPPPLPCHQQTSTLYFYSKLQCSENPERPGVWITTNSDPFNCEGYCNYTIASTTSPPTPPAPPTPPPCEEQDSTNFFYSMLQCSENPDRPGVWITTNSDPFNCEGYCNYTIASTTSPPLPPCDEQYESKFYIEMIQCVENSDNPGKWTITNLDPSNCQGYCTSATDPLPPCEEQYESNYYHSMSECKNSDNPGKWKITNNNPLKCQGYCDYSESGETSPPPLPCDKQVNTQYWHESRQCSEDPDNRGVWIVTNSNPLSCEGYCDRDGGPVLPPPPPPPCNQQTYTPYWYEMMQCGESPMNPGVWIVTNSDPFNCEGYCQHTGGPTPPPPPPCDEQEGSPYWYEMRQCGESITNPGTWVVTNSDPFNCEGYCDYSGGPTPPPLVDCDLQLLKQECSFHKHCSLKIIDLEKCQTECVCPKCDKIFDIERENCENVEAKKIQCKYEVIDDSKCFGKCVCEHKAVPKRMKCQQVEHFEP